MRNTDIRSVLRAAQETPWAILPGKLAEIRSFLMDRASGYESRMIEAREGPQPQRVGSVAVIPVFGTIAPRMNMMTEFSGGTSVDVLTSQLRSAVQDRDVSSILLEFDTPGGAVDGVPELADEIRQSRDTKRIVASVNSRAASAGYWLASQASEISMTPSGDAGSIGVFAMHEDLSKASEDLGIKTTFISAGKFKTEGNPFEPLSDDARAHIQSQVDSFREMFVESVAAGRNKTTHRIRTDFGEYAEGRMALARKAKEIGMVDRVETRDATLSRMLRRSGRSATTRASIETVRDFESFLIDEGFSRSEALAISSTNRDLFSSLRDADDDPREAGDNNNPVIPRDAGERFEQILTGGKHGT